MSGTRAHGPGLMSDPRLLAAGAAGFASAAAALWAFRGLPMGTALFWLSSFPIFAAGLGFAREVEIISHRVGVSTAEMVARALRGYGGMEKLIAEYGVSEPIRKLDDYLKLDPATASEEELLGGKYAAGKDAELEQDEQVD